MGRHFVFLILCKNKIFTNEHKNFYLMTVVYGVKGEKLSYLYRY